MRRRNRIFFSLLCILVLIGSIWVPLLALTGTDPCDSLQQNSFVQYENVTVSQIPNTDVVGYTLSKEELQVGMMEYTLHDPQTLTIQLAGRTTTVAHILSDGSLALHYGEGDQVIGTTNAYLDARTGAVFAFYQGTWKLTFDTETGKVSFEPSGDAVLPQELFPLGAQVLVSEDGKNYDLLMPTTQRTQKQGFLWMDTKQYHLPEGVQSVRICPTAGFQDDQIQKGYYTPLVTGITFSGDHFGWGSASTEESSQGEISSNGEPESSKSSSQHSEAGGGNTRPATGGSTGQGNASGNGEIAGGGSSLVGEEEVGSLSTSGVTEETNTASSSTDWRTYLAWIYLIVAAVAILVVLLWKNRRENEK